MDDNKEQDVMEEEYLELKPEDVEQAIEIEDNGSGENEMVNDMDDLDIVTDEDLEGEGAEIEDNAETVFTKHTGAVFACAIDPQTNQLAVSGSEDDKAYVWKIDSGEVILECTGHSDSVTGVSFSHDSAYLATADMGGNLKVWKMSTKEEIWNFAVGEDLEWITWHHGAHVLLAGFASGDTWMWKIPSGECKTFLSHGKIESNIGKMFPDGKRACVGYGDGSIKVWDLKTGAAIQTFSGHNSHESSVTCMDCHHDNNLMATGSTDQYAKVFSSNSGKILCTFDCSTKTQNEDKDKEEDNDTENSVEAIGFSKVNNYLATGTLNGMLSIWDISSQTCRHQCQHEAGITRLKWDNSSMIYTTTLDGMVHMWDTKNGQKVAQWSGHEGEILDMDISKDWSVMATASEDKTCRVFVLQTVDR